MRTDFYHRDAVELSLIQLGKTGSWNAGALHREVFRGTPGNAVGVVSYDGLICRSVFFLSHFSPDEPIPHFRNLDEEQSTALMAALIGLPSSGNPRILPLPIADYSGIVRRIQNEKLCNIGAKVIDGAQRKRTTHILILKNSGLIAFSGATIVATLGNRDLALAMAEVIENDNKM